MSQPGQEQPSFGGELCKPVLAPALTQHLVPRLEDVAPQPSSSSTCSAGDSSTELPPGAELEAFHIPEATRFQEKLLDFFFSRKTQGNLSGDQDPC